MVEGKVLRVTQKSHKSPNDFQNPMGSMTFEKHGICRLLSGSSDFFPLPGDLLAQSHFLRNFLRDTPEDRVKVHLYEHRHMHLSIAFQVRLVVFVSNIFYGHPDPLGKPPTRVVTQHYEMLSCSKMFEKHRNTQSPCVCVFFGGVFLSCHAIHGSRVRIQIHALPCWYCGASIDTSLASKNMMICPDICFEFSESRPSNRTGILVCSCFRFCLLGHLNLELYCMKSCTMIVRLLK